MAYFDDPFSQSKQPKEYFQPPGHQHHYRPDPSLVRAFLGGGFPDEPPLHEELGISIQQIYTKSYQVLFPFSKDTENVHNDETDLIGPLIFFISFSFILLLGGKVHFSYIYVISILGIGFIYSLLSLMGFQSLSGAYVASSLGYSFLPLLIASTFIVIIRPASTTLNILITISAIFWASFCATTSFITLSDPKNQFFLVLYPTALFYSFFALSVIN